MHEFDASSLGLGAPAASLALPDEAATRAFGARIARAFARGGFIGLVGDLGAGKTTLVQGLVATLGAEASSPTYTLLNEYESQPRVVHFDLYRLHSAAELESIAYWDFAEDPDAIVVVEWIDRVPVAWPGQGWLVELRHDGGQRRASLWVRGDVPDWRDVFHNPSNGRDIDATE